MSIRQVQPDGALPPEAAGHANGDAARPSPPWFSSALGPVDTWPPELRTAAAVLRAAAAPMALCWGPDLVFLPNDAAARLLSGAHAPAFGRPLRECWPERWAELEPAARAALAGRQASVTLPPPARADGPVSPDLTLSFSAVTAGTAGAAGLICAITSHASDAATPGDGGVLRGDGDRLEAIIDSVNAVIYVKDLAGRYLLVNRHYEQVLNLPRQRVLGLTDHDLFPAPVADAFVANDRAVIASGQAARLEETAPHPDGPHVYISHKFPLRDPSGKIHALCGVSTDITERKRAEGAAREAREQLQFVADTMSACVARCSRDRRFVWVNKPYADRFGLRPDDITGRPVVEVLGEETYAAIKPHIDAVLAGEPVEYEVFVHHGLPGRCWLQVRYSPTFDQRGAPDGWIAVVSDVTARKELERAVLSSEERYRVLSEVMPQLVWTADADGAVDYCNSRWMAYTGLTPDEVRGEGWVRAVHPDDLAPLLEVWRGATERGEEYQAEVRLRASSGAYRWFLNRALPVRDGAGRVVKWYGTCTDIEDFRRAIESLRENREQLRAAFAAARMVAWTYDPAADRMTYSENAPDVYGRSPGESAGEGWNLVHPDDLERHRATVQRAIDAGGSYVSAFRYPTPGGEIRWLEDYGRAELNAQGRLVRLAGVIMDVTDRKRAEEAFARLAAIVESSEDAIIGKNLDGLITSWNRAAERIFGYAPDEIVGRPLILLLPPERIDEEQRILARLRAGERIESLETVRVRKDGRRIDVAVTVSPIRDVSGAIVGASKIVRDITDRKRMEQALRASNERLEEAVRERTRQLEESHNRLRISERMAALGTLSAGIGHDMGNLLLPIRARLEVLAERDLPADCAEDVRAISAAARYLQSLANGLRMLAQDPMSPASEALDLGNWCSDTESLLRNVVPRHVRVECDIPDDLPRVAISRAGLTQAVFNLVQNAGEAMRERPAGHVRVCARPAPDGRHVRVTVADDGPGMPEDVRRRCMEPFFTTKPRALSTGLGLALVHGVTTAAGGTVEVESEFGRGTTFVLTLPIARRPVGGSTPGGVSVRITIPDPRVHGYVSAFASAMGYTLADGTPSPAERLWIVAPESVPPPAVEEFLNADQSRWAVLLGDGPTGGHPRAIHVPGRFEPAALRQALKKIAQAGA